VAASIAVAAATVAVLHTEHDAPGVVTNSPSSTTATTAPVTTAPAPTSTMPRSSTGSRSSTPASPTVTTGTSLLTEPELADRCGRPQVEFRSDCSAPRPATFVPGEGGCAHLGGYLAVYYGTAPALPSGVANDPAYRFAVGDDVWWIVPESD